MTADGTGETAPLLNEIGEEQAALRRVATLVATGTESAALFASVAEESVALFSADIASINRIEPDGEVVLVAGWGLTDWHLRRRTNLTWEQLVAWIGPVIRGWMTYYGRFRHSELHQLLARVNRRIQQWIRAKYRRLRPYRAMKRAWDRITTQNPGLLPHWRWETGAWF